MRRRTALPVTFALAAAAASLALAAPSTAATSSFTWRQHPVADNSSITEPSLSIDKNGRIFVCGPGGAGGTGNAGWYSFDDGVTFTRKDTAGDQGDGGGDCELQYLPDGSLVTADLAIRSSVIFRSTDGGKTFTQQADAGSEQDRQWFAYDERKKELYLVYHDIVAELEMYVTSSDGGKTWSTPTLVNSADQFAGPPNVIATPGQTASLVDQGYNTFSGPMLIDQSRGHQYVLYSVSSAQDNLTSVGGFGPTRGIVVAHRGPEDTGFTNKYAVVSSGVPGGGGEVNGAIFPWGTIDPAGNVYVVYNSSVGGTFHTYYVVSTDHAATWSKPVKVDGNPLDKGATVYATGQAGAAGVLDLAWYQSDDATSPDDSNAHWYVDFAQVRNAASPAPQVSRSRISDHIVHHGSICQKGILCVTSLGDDRSLGDFFELAIGPDGLAQVAFTDNGNKGTTGAPPRRVFWAKQASGPSAFSAAVPAAPVTGAAPAAPPAAPPAAAPTSGGNLAATGLDSALPAAALLLLAATGLVAHRRRRTE
ncbi:MAG: exo-alpha-sialidase [Frankiaceae bacterium]|nr:exo-alpha-sialidase [Frankiaceae bacterium]